MALTVLPLQYDSLVHMQSIRTWIENVCVHKRVLRSGYVAPPTASWGSVESFIVIACSHTHTDNYCNILYLPICLHTIHGIVAAIITVSVAEREGKGRPVC